MKTDSRLSSVLHVLLHMAHHEQALTSEQLSSYLHTNPVVVRRVLAGLRDMGLVDSVKGPGGGWSLRCDLHQVTLRDIYVAVGSPSFFAMGNRSENPTCLVELAVNEALDGAFLDAQALLIARLGAVTLADLAADFSRRLAIHQGNINHAH